MAVPFYIPEEDESNVPQAGEASAASSSNNTPAASPSRPIPIPLRSNPQSPQSSPIDNEVLVQAFYEALCRCSQGLYARQKKIVSWSNVEKCLHKFNAHDAFTQINGEKFQWRKKTNKQFFQ